MQSYNILPHNPLKRPYSHNQEDLEINRVTKRSYKTHRKEETKKTIDPEKRHLLLISSMKQMNLKPKSIPDFRIQKDFSIHNDLFENISSYSYQKMQEKKAIVQHELDLYKEQIAFYSRENCCYEDNKEDCPEYLNNH